MYIYLVPSNRYILYTFLIVKIKIIIYYKFIILYLGQSKSERSITVSYTFVCVN